jgi:hypothetical protein
MDFLRQIGQMFGNRAGQPGFEQIKKAGIFAGVAYLISEAFKSVSPFLSGLFKMFGNLLGGLLGLNTQQPQAANPAVNFPAAAPINPPAVNMVPPPGVNPLTWAYQNFMRPAAVPNNQPAPRPAPVPRPAGYNPWVGM